jgi:hypothetical protein
MTSAAPAPARSSHTACSCTSTTNSRCDSRLFSYTHACSNATPGTQGLTYSSWAEKLPRLADTLTSD